MNRAITAITIAAFSTILLTWAPTTAYGGVVADFGAHLEVFDRNGNLIRDAFCVGDFPNVTTISIFVRGPTTVEITDDGSVVDTIEKPKQANRLIVSIFKDTGQLGSLRWANQMGTFDTVTVPAGANDVHVDSKKVIQVSGDCSALNGTDRGATSVSLEAQPDI